MTLQITGISHLWIHWTHWIQRQVTYLSQELEEAQAQRSEFRWSLATGSSGLIWVDSVDDVDFDSQILFGWFILVQ